MKKNLTPDTYLLLLQDDKFKVTVKKIWHKNGKPYRSRDVNWVTIDRVLTTGEQRRALNSIAKKMGATT